MELDPRKSRILTCVVESYIRTGEPIGSKMIAAMLEETVSSATVRNDLAYLSEQGYIEQPHTSAGRIPTHRGLRYYLDHLMKPQPLEDAARAQNVQVLYAGIAAPVSDGDTHLTRASIDFHTRRGYEIVGTFHRCGYKFDTWYDVVWMEKRLSDAAVPAPVTPFSAFVK